VLTVSLWILLDPPQDLAVYFPTAVCEYVAGVLARRCLDR
jgi:hypothetical protein